MTDGTDVPVVALRGGQPTPGETAAIVAAVEQAWPRPVPVPPSARSAERGPRGWRWSGRWWAPREVVARRARP